jgi:hypothetical protein
MNCGKTRMRAPSWTRLCTKDALSMPCRYFPRPMRRECCCISCSPASLASREPCRMDCARAADTVSALYVARGEAGTWNEIARRTLEAAFRGRLKAKRVSMLACVGSREYRSCGRLREKVETTLNFKFGFPVPFPFPTGPGSPLYEHMVPNLMARISISLIIHIIVSTSHIQPIYLQ